ncbi:9974_t:CDS:2, partial [Gigaspora margarita]
NVAKFKKKSNLKGIRLYSTPNFTLNSTTSKCTRELPKSTPDHIVNISYQNSEERIHSFARLSFRWMDAYRHGLTGKVAEYVVKNNKRHRSVNEEIMNQITNELLN